MNEINKKANKKELLMQNKKLREFLKAFYCPDLSKAEPLSFLDKKRKIINY